MKNVLQKRTESWIHRSLKKPALPQNSPQENYCQIYHTLSYHVYTGTRIPSIQITVATINKIAFLFFKALNAHQRIELYCTSCNVICSLFLFASTMAIFVLQYNGRPRHTFYLENNVAIIPPVYQMKYLEKIIAIGRFLSFSAAPMQSLIKRTFFSEIRRLDAEMDRINSVLVQIR